MINYFKGVHKDAGVKYENYKDILITPMFKESFCKELCKIGKELKNNFNYWHQSQVAKDSTLYFNIMRSKYFAGEKFFEDFTIHYSQTISKMISKEWPSTKVIGWFDPFIVRYDGSKKDELHLHTDVSHITMVIKLNNDFEGGLLKLPRQKFDNKKIPIGHALIFPSQVTHPHTVSAVTSGVKYSMTSWTWPVYWREHGIAWREEMHK